jgi:hypothetical protein
MLRGEGTFLVLLTTAELRVGTMYQDFLPLVAGVLELIS